MTIVEQERVGGVCLNHGCIPSKIMKHSADLMEKLAKAEELGVRGAGNLQIDLKKLLARHGKVIGALAQGIEAQLKMAGVRQLAGKATITAKGVLSVAAADNSPVAVDWDSLIIATGSSPLELAALPFDGELVLSSSDLLKIAELPASLIIVGGGVIGCEFAFIMRAFGVEVKLIEGLSRLLPFPEIELKFGKILGRQMKKAGITLYLNKMVEDLELYGDEVKVGLAGGETLIAERLLVSAGRQPNSVGLGLENLKVATDRHGWIKVDRFMRTSNPQVFAIGDVLGPVRPMLAHVAAREGMVAAANALKIRTRMDYHAVPTVVFSRPEIGVVGLTEQAALESGYEVECREMQFRACGKAHVIDEIDGMVKIVAEQQSGRILGLHIIGPHASDLIAEGALAVKNGLTLEQLADTIHAHPTLAEIIMECAQLRT